LDTRNLETLVAVAQRGSLAAAAQHLNLTATAVAQRIRALEDEIGADLVARSGRTVRPTEAGHAVLAHAEGVLAAYRSLRAAVTGQTIAGSLRIGAISTVLTGILPDVLMSLSRSDADLRIFLEPGTSNDLYDRTIAGHLDAAAVVKPSFDLPKAWDFQTWRREKLVLLIPSNETRTDIGAILGDSPFIRYDRQQWGGRAPQTWLSDAGIIPDVRYELDALDVIAVLVGRGLGVSIVPDWIGPRPEGAAIRSLPLPDPAPFREIGLLWQRHSPRIQLLRKVMQTVTQIS